MQDKIYFDKMQDTDAAIIVAQGTTYGSSISEALEGVNNRTIYCNNIPTVNEVHKIIEKGISTIVIKKMETIPPGDYTELIEILHSNMILLRRFDGNKKNLY